MLKYTSERMRGSSTAALAIYASAAGAKVRVRRAGEISLAAAFGKLPFMRKISYISFFARAAVLAIGVAAVSACSENTPPLSAPGSPTGSKATAAKTTVTIVQAAYWPKTLRIKIGTSVRFINKDDLTHTVTANDGSFGSPFLTKGHGWHHTFAATGKYPYHCVIHPYMTGTVIVTKS